MIPDSIADKELVARITDKFNNAYYLQATAEDGTVTINTESMIPHFTRYSGTFTMEILENIDDCDPLALQFCGNTFSCFSLSFQKVTGEDKEARIGCNCD